MELVYAWIEKFRNYKGVELNFSEKFIIKFDKYNNRIKITKNKSYIAIYPKYITNINAIVGKNGVGKTNLLDVLGIKPEDRNKNNAEFELKYKEGKGPFYKMPDDIESEIKHSIYFFIYYMGKDENNQDLFCFEGNDIESFQKLINFGPRTEMDIQYWKSKYWFAFICNYSEEMLIHKYDLNVKWGEYRTRTSKMRMGPYSDDKSEQDKLVIISLRENLNDKYYNYSSTQPIDGNRIAVPRRNAYFQSKLLAMKVQMLYKQLHKPKRLMFQNDIYTLKIRYEMYSLNNKLGLESTSTDNELNGREEKVCKVLEFFVCYFFRSVNKNSKESVNQEKIFSEVSVKKKNLKGFKDYYFNIINRISDTYIKNEEVKQHILEYYMDLAEVLSRNKKLKFYQNYISIDISKQVNMEELIKVIDVTVDEKVHSDIDEKSSVFGDFFDYSIEDLSDGEAAYLGFFASIYEQVSYLTPAKERYIILLDEPETRMHPELTRNFIDEMILFLGDIHEGVKTFQVVISTHSPFILSDIQSNNIIYLEKDSSGFSKPLRPMLNTFGANIHTLLKDGFFMYSTMGEFATKKIKEVISSINVSVVEDVTEEQKNEWLYIINSIGEPLIQRRIMKMFNDKFVLNYTDLYNENLKLRVKLKKYEEPRQISETIEVLMKQIEQLQIHVNKLEGK
ncbi:AAA family ATPase [Bacillus cereus]|uniref:AAA family ATPase n=1 Tax=Bacillus cereus TaxID=1396 RepID=A0AAW7NFX8_BACCE|nr:AAA family ATPase [Bacillus cereus]MDA2046921.1 AAA family ATPase [Bacillus cereus]MDN4873428.1 AAA family ATPase [Bacillus cereus]